MLFLGSIFNMLKKSIIFLFCIQCGTINQNQLKSCEDDGMINFTYINIPCKECVYFIQDLFNSNKAIFNYDITEIECFGEESTINMGIDGPEGPLSG